MLKKYPAILIGRGKLQSKVYKVYFLRQATSFQQGNLGKMSILILFVTISRIGFRDTLEVSKSDHPQPPRVYRSRYGSYRNRQQQYRDTR